MGSGTGKCGFIQCDCTKTTNPIIEGRGFASSCEFRIGKMEKKSIERKNDDGSSCSMNVASSHELTQGRETPIKKASVTIHLHH